MPKKNKIKKGWKRNLVDFNSIHTICNRHYLYLKLTYSHTHLPFNKTLQQLNIKGKTAVYQYSHPKNDKLLTTRTINKIEKKSGD